MGYESSVTMLNCPPGLWCKKDMTVTNDDTTESICPSGVKCSSKRLVHYKNSDECPPGLWCKRRTAVGADRIINKYCSTGPWCDLKLAVDNTVARRMFNDEKCSPGLSCK